MTNIGEGGGRGEGKERRELFYSTHWTSLSSVPVTTFLVSQCTHNTADSNYQQGMGIWAFSYC